MALAAAMLTASPAAARDDLFSGTPEPSLPTTEDTSPGGSGPGDLMPGDTDGGAVGNTGAGVYSVGRTPGSNVPTGVSVVTEPVGDAELFGFTADDGESAFIALIKINSADASTEYRFENAVPDDAEAHFGDDGSILFVDADGNEAGYISPAWAYDATGAAVPTSYSIDGTTLVQTVDHHGATYPVVADPSWWETAALFVGAAAAGAGAACLLSGVCAVPAVTAITIVGVVAAATAVVGYMIPDSSTGTSQRPTNTCNSRNRRGC